MIPIYFFLTPAVLAMLWVLYTKYQQRKFIDLLLLILASVAALLNVFLVYKMLVSGLGLGASLMQMTSASILIPLLYMYFACQVGKRSANSTATILLWLLAVLTFVPNVIISNPFKPLAFPEESLKPFTFYVILQGEKIRAMRSGDFVTILQCLVTILRIVPFTLMLRKHNLHLNRKVYAFLTCWMLIIVFIVMVSGMTYNELRSPAGSFFYFFFYTLLFIFACTLIAKGYDLYPIETETHEAVEDINVYVQQQYGVMAGKLRSIIEEKQLYKDPLISAESVIEQLNTNHTYFSKMMSSVWGVSFSEYINNLRLSHAKRLLSDDSLTISIIATQSGFTDAGYMTRKFKAKYGLTPSEWRKQH